MDEFILVMDDDDELDLVMDSDEEVALTIDIAEIVFPEYTGSTEYTPTQTAQVAFTAGKVVLDNITINPIPSNYGLITYQGNIITIT